MTEITEQEIRDVEVELYRAKVLNKIPNREAALAVIAERRKAQSPVLGHLEPKPRDTEVREPLHGGGDY